jgi:hypothetical protein
MIEQLPPVGSKLIVFVSSQPVKHVILITQ